MEMNQHFRGPISTKCVNLELHDSWGFMIVVFDIASIRQRERQT